MGMASTNLWIALLWIYGSYNYESNLCLLLTDWICAISTHMWAFDKGMYEPVQALVECGSTHIKNIKYELANVKYEPGKCMNLCLPMYEPGTITEG